MSGGYRTSPLVDSQIDQIYEFTLDRWGEEQADRYIRGLYAFFDDISAKRVIWRAIPAEFDVKGFVGKCEKHFVYWRPLSADDVGIVSVLHERMHQIELIRVLFPQ